MDKKDMKLTGRVLEDGTQEVLVHASYEMAIAILAGFVLAMTENGKADSNEIMSDVLITVIHNKKNRETLAEKTFEGPLN